MMIGYRGHKYDGDPEVHLEEGTRVSQFSLVLKYYFQKNGVRYPAQTAVQIHISLFRNIIYLVQGFVWRETKIISYCLKKWLNRPDAIEPVIGQLKTDNGLDKNYLKGVGGDLINDILNGCGLNSTKAHCPDTIVILQATLFDLNIIQTKIAQIWQVIRYINPGYKAI